MKMGESAYFDVCNKQNPMNITIKGENSTILTFILTCKNE
jgi:hypothetical protein